MILRVLAAWSNCCHSLWYCVCDVRDILRPDGDGIRGHGWKSVDGGGLVGARIVWTGGRRCWCARLVCWLKKCTRGSKTIRNVRMIQDKGREQTSWGARVGREYMMSSVLVDGVLNWTVDLESRCKHGKAEVGPGPCVLPRLNGNIPLSRGNSVVCTVVLLRPTVQSCAEVEVQVQVQLVCLKEEHFYLLHLSYSLLTSTRRGDIIRAEWQERCLKQKVF